MVAIRPDRSIAGYGVVGPSFGDPRLWLASVIVSIHVLGQVALGFHVSVPQILASIGACALLEVAVTARRERMIAWPASAMLTGSGVALILRVVDTPVGDHWGTTDWWIFAVVGALSLTTKYVFRAGGRPVFNPSNAGLVAAFVIVGEERIEPLDFWWGPWSPALLAGTALIVIGGVLITERLRLLAMASAFWITFAMGLAVVAARGHCLTARWSLDPVCGWRLFDVVAFSPEVLVFLFFMLTDPKTTPSRPIPRALFGVAVAMVAVLAIGRATNEFDAKVGLLGALVVMCVIRIPVGRAWSQLQIRTTRRSPSRPTPRLAGPYVAAVSLAGLGFLGSVAALTTPSTLGAGRAGPEVRAGLADGARDDWRGLVVAGVAREVDADALVAMTIGDGVRAIAPDVGIPQAMAIQRDLLVDLGVIELAMSRLDEGLAARATSDDRLLEIVRELEAARTSGVITTRRFTFDSARLVITRPGGPQAAPLLGVEVSATLRVTTSSVPFLGVDPTIARSVRTTIAPYVGVFAMAPTAGGHSIAAEQPTSR